MLPELQKCLFSAQVTQRVGDYSGKSDVWVYAERNFRRKRCDGKKSCNPNLFAQRQ